MEVLRFVFSSFWIWLGVLFLIATTGNFIVETIKAIRPPRKIVTYKIGDRWNITIDGASKNDVAVALQYAKENGAEWRADNECGAFKQ